MLGMLTLLHIPLLTVLINPPVQTVETELPETAASMRLTGLELSDAISELGGLGNDLSGGIR